MLGVEGGNLISLYVDVNGAFKLIELEQIFDLSQNLNNIAQSNRRNAISLKECAVDNFWSNVWSGLVVALISGIVTSLTPIVLPKLSRNRGDGSSSGSTAINAKTVRAGNDVTVDSSSYKNASIVRANYNITVNQDLGNTPNSSDAEMPIIFIGVILSAGLFVTFHNYLTWVVGGMAAGLAASTLYVTFDTYRLKVWDRKAVQVLLASTSSIVCALYSCWARANVTYGDSSIKSIQLSVADDLSDKKYDDGISGVIEHLIAPGIQLLKNGWVNHQLVFVVVMMFGMALAVVLVVQNFVDILNWNSSNGFYFGPQRGRVAKFATRHQKYNWKTLLGVIIFSSLSILFSSGILIDWFDNLQTSI